VPLQVKIVPVWLPGPLGNVSVLSDDAKGAYINGVAGVTTKIDFCGFSGATYNATVFLGNTKRSIGFTLPEPIPGSIIYDGSAPTWAGGATVWAQPYFKVGDILWGRRNGNPPSFTTRMAIARIKDPSERTPTF